MWSCLVKIFSGTDLDQKVNVIGGWGKLHNTEQDFTAASMKMAVFWVVAPCSLVEVYQRFRGTCCLHHQGEYQLS
jgi:hypothetical protein